MTKDEALKLALKFLESMMTHQWRARDIYNLKDAIKEALAQPEQEPVGWAEYGVINWLADKQFNHTSFLYDTPPQRTWVGLTDEEMQDLWDRYAHMEMMRAIEAKLKEKNNG